LDEALGSLERLDPRAGAVAQEAVSAVVGLYEEALDRLVELAEQRPDGVTLAGLAADPLWSGVLSLHGVHPVPVLDRVEEALESVRPYLDAHSGGVRIHDLAGDVLTVELLGGCHGCSASQQTLRGLIETTVTDAVPEVADVRVTEASAAQPIGPALLQITPRTEYDTCPFPEGGT
jgi:Fe-S cluster biogenesis protein NfuA